MNNNDIKIIAEYWLFDFIENDIEFARLDRVLEQFDLDEENKQEIDRELYTLLKIAFEEGYKTHLKEIKELNLLDNLRRYTILQEYGRDNRKINGFDLNNDNWNRKN